MPASLANGGTDWLATATQVREATIGGDSCAESVAAAITPHVRDRFSFRFTLPIVFRSDMSEGENRTRFIEERAARAVPLADHEMEALRQLGYAE